MKKIYTTPQTTFVELKTPICGTLEMSGEKQKGANALSQKNTHKETKEWEGIKADSFWK